MTSNQLDRIAVIGDGPAATTLATLLARRGKRVGLFSRGERHSPLIGESTVPALIPILQRLGVEDEVRSYSVYKPGATFTLGRDESLELDFDEVRGRVPGYAFNVPRDRFDATLLDACARSGAQLFRTAGRVETANGQSGPTSRVRLTDACIDETDRFFDGQPDFIVDASGRNRAIPTLLDLPTRAGARRDHALFAHCEGVPIDKAGHIHTDRLEHGWCWRIPLPGRVSMGFVINPSRLREMSNRPEQQYDALLHEDPEVARIAGQAKRVSDVVRFTNYQLSTQLGIGPGWALVGDSLGFVDPVFSSGLFLAMDGAVKLADAIATGTDAALRRYDRDQRRHISAWQTVVDYFYDGRFYAMLRLRNQPHDNWIGRLLGPHLGRHLPRVFTGESTASRYDPRLLQLVMKYSLGVLEDPDWARWRIR
jgi:flavin-dependent dehydrogenase